MCSLDKKTRTPTLVNETFNVWQTELAKAYHYRENLAEYNGEYQRVEFGFSTMLVLTINLYLLQQ